FWYHYKQVRDLQAHLSHEPSDAYKPTQDGAGYISDIDISEVNISDMNPDDIRAELKRLYTQLEILKNKTLRQNNPHISKRRGGRKVAHRRFSLQVSWINLRLARTLNREQTSVYLWDYKQGG
ncbi:probable G-protein coupled receptor 158, partial [Diaphorina citri]|uniref:Probable G-protein coupled receptor 158 n=1 Tax=Diaphorina citri TaxID=121845 RepID=A0A3Q0JJJ3_DIACI